MNKKPGIIKSIFRKIGNSLSKFFFNIYKLTFSASKTKNILVLVIFFLIGFTLYAHFFWEDTKTAFIGTLAGLLTALFLSSVGFLISVHFEDRQKVNEDNNLMKKTYSKSYQNYLSFNESEDILVYYDLHENISSIIIEDNFEKHFEPNETIHTYYHKLYSAHRGSFKTNNFMLRVDDFNINERGVLKLKTSRTTYFNHLVTNRVIDFPFEKSLSLRLLFEPGPFINNLNTSNFSNHLGLIGLIYTSDGYIILNHRSGTGTVSKNSVVSPIAIGVKASNLKNVDNNYFDNLIKERVLDRVGAKESDLKHLNNIKPLAFGRSIYEGGKPHLFYLIEINVTKDNYLKQLEASLEVKNKKQLDYDKEVYATKLDEIKYVNNALYFPVHNGGKIKYKWLKAEVNLLINIHLAKKYLNIK